MRRLSVRLAWSLILLAPALAFADGAVALPTTQGGLVALIVSAIGGTSVLLFLLHKLGPWLFHFLATEVPVATKAADAQVAKADPDHADVEAHAIDQLGDALSEALEDIGASTATISTLDKATLLGVLSSAEKKFASKVDASTLEGALLALGNKLLGGVGGWAKGKLLRLVHAHQLAAATAPAPVAPSEKREVKAPSGRIIVEPVTSPIPGDATPVTP